MSTFVNGITQGIERWSRAEQWPVPRNFLGHRVLSFFPLAWLEQKSRREGDFLTAHLATAFRMRYTLEVVREALQAWGQENYCPTSRELIFAMATPLSLFFVPRQWKATAFLQNHLSEIGLAIQAISAVALYRKDHTLAATTAGWLVLERTVEYFEVIPVKWQTRLHIIKFLSPQLLSYALNLANFRKEPQQAGTVLFRAAVIGAAVLIARGLWRTWFPQHKIDPKQTYRVEFLRLIINPSLDLLAKTRSATPAADADIDQRLEHWFYGELRNRYRGTITDEGYWATQFSGTAEERKARFPTSSLVKAGEVLNDLPKDLRTDWMRKHFGGRTEIPLHAYFQSREELVREGKIDRKTAASVVEVERTFDRLPGRNWFIDPSDRNQPRSGENCPEALKPLLSLYLTLIAGKKPIAKLESVLQAPTKEAMFESVKALYAEHEPKKSKDVGGYFELELDLLRQAGAKWETDVPEARIARDAPEEDWLKVRLVKQREIVDALMLMQFDFARQS